MAKGSARLPVMSAVVSHMTKGKSAMPSTPSWIPHGLTEGGLLPLAPSGIRFTGCSCAEPLAP